LGKILLKVKAYYRDNIQFYLIFIFLLLIGMYGGPLVYVAFPLALIRMKQREMYAELLIGLFLILILSDSEEPRLMFAKSIKIIYVVILALFVFFDKKAFTPYNSLYKIFIPFFLISLYCVLFSETMDIGIQKTFSYFILFLVVPNFITKLFREQGTQIFKSIIFFGATILAIGILFIVLDESIAYNIVIGRFRGVFGNPNGLGLFCFLFFALFYVLNKTFTNLFSPKGKLFIYSLIILSIILSNSRNAFFSVLILLLFTRFFKESLFWGFIVSIVFIFMNYILIGQLPILLESLGLQTFLRLDTINTLSGRSVAWEFAWAKIQDNIFIGKGFGYDEYLMRKYSHMLGMLGHQGGVHSSFLSLWLNFGLVGLLIYMRSFFLTFLKAAKVNKLAFPLMYAVLFTATFEGLFIGSLNPQMIILLMIITIVSESEFSEENSKEEIPDTSIERNYEIA